MTHSRNRYAKFFLLILIGISCLVVLSINFWTRTVLSNTFHGARYSMASGLSESEKGSPDGPTASTGPMLDASRNAKIVLRAASAQLPLSFEVNRGQADAQVQFLSRVNGYSLFLTSTEAVLTKNERGTRNDEDESMKDENERTKAKGERRATSSHNVPRFSLRVHGSSLKTLLRMRLVGANPNARLVGVQQLPWKSNYLIGSNPERWHTDIPAYARVEQDEVYAGVKLVYYGNQRQLEYDFVLAPGANPNLIRLAFEGARSVRIDRSGDLVLRTASGEIRQHRPSVYQEVDGERRMLAGRYVLKGRHEVGFEVGPHDELEPLVIDPTLVYSTYLGGGSDDSGSSIAVDSSGNVYVTGTTSSINFPVKDSPQAANAGSGDVFITKLDSTGQSLIYSTYLGGALSDRGDGIAVDSSGNAYIVGRTDSTDYPATASAFATTYRGGDFDAFVTKLNAQGNGLIYSTYLGGSDNDSAEGITLDSSNNAYVTGGSRSFDFPTTATAYQPASNGTTEAYVTKLNASGSALVYSTFLGGSATDRGSSIVVDQTGNAYLAGLTNSVNFPTQNAFQNSSGGSFDAFVAKLNPGGSNLIYSTYLGGVGDDKGYGIALDAGNNVYVAGETASNNFPVANALQPAFGGLHDAFVAKIGPTGAKLYATYLGGSADDRATAIAVNAAGNVYLTGFTFSNNFPTTNALQTANGGGADAFVAKLDTAGSALVFSTYLGGSANENFTNTVTYSGAIALDSASNVYVTGQTASTNFPTSAALQATNAGTTDAFVAKISDAVVPGDFSLAATPPSQTVAPGNSATYNINATPSGGFTGNITLNAVGLPDEISFNFNPTSLSITDASAKSSTLTVAPGANTPPGTYIININATSGSLQHSTTVTLIVPGTPAVDLSLSKTASPNPATVQSSLTYRLTVTNNGPSPATGVIVTDTLPASVSFVSATPTQGTCSGTSTVNCNLGPLSRGGIATVNIIVTPQAAGPLNNSASVNANENDTNSGDNAASVQINVEQQATGPSMLDPNLTIRTVVSGLVNPTSMAFLGPNDFLVLEKSTGKVQRIVNGVVQGTVLDLPVNNASERGLLGIALHPDFVVNGFVYLYWTESSTGADSGNLADVPLLGNRVDRYVWNGSTLSFDRNLIKLHAYQADANQPLRGNHNGGVIRFGPDGRLYIIIGDNGRRGLLQNITSGGPVPDDQFGGPEPDNAHLTGVILRLNEDGTTPSDNPFFNASIGLSGEAAANVKKIYAYGIRNSFGMAFDPLSTNLWTQENGDDSFDEINRVGPGFNGGWIQVMGPLSRLAQFKSIETTYGTKDLQQLRWSPTLIADQPSDVLARLFNLPGSHYTDPEFSWKYAVAPSPLGFMRGRGLGSQYEGDMFLGASRTFLAGGYLFRFKLGNDRQHLAFNDTRLSDMVADNLDKFDITESESLLVGRDFGITTDIETGPNGNLFIVSLSNGAVYEISAKPPTLFVANLNGAQETPPNNSSPTGTATILLNPDETTARVSLNFNRLTSTQTAAHIHGPASTGNSANVLFPLPLGSSSDYQINLTPAQVQDLKAGLLYINVHSNAFPNGEIRGQFQSNATASSLQFDASSYTVSESGGQAIITVNRYGDTSQAVTVDYAASNGTASSRTDYIAASGTLRFAPGETSKTFNVLITDDVYVEGSETVNLTLSNPTGGAYLGSPTAATLTITDNDSAPPNVNPLDDAQFFVRQHYLDFLNREPDPGGLIYWTNQITKCGTDASCLTDRRIGVSAAFFIETEFRQTGFFLYRLRRAALGLRPTFAQYTADRNQLGTGSDADRQTFTLAFVQRPEFIAKYPMSQSGSEFIDALLLNIRQSSGVDLSSKRAELATEYAVGQTPAESRARVLQKVIEYQEYVPAEYSAAFVLAEYFGYLRRDPDAGGYAFWLNVLNQREVGNYRGMVCAFITSAEYQLRFSSVVTHSNRECDGIH